MGMIEIPIERREPVMRWIPVSERLPELGQQVLVTTSNGEVRHCTQDSIRAQMFRIFGRRDIQVIGKAWMPLPEPYKGDA